MSDKEEIIANTEATLAIEGMPLSEEDVSILDDCLSGKISFDDAVAAAIEELKVV